LVLRRLGYLKKQSRYYGSEFGVKNEETNLKKQSQFAGCKNRRKLLIEGKLWQNLSLRGTKKQSQYYSS
jgi:hypothetical protein